MIKHSFDASYLDNDAPTSHRNYGKTWTTDERVELAKLFMSGHTLQRMCEKLGRPASGVLPKLEDMSLIEKIAGTYFRNDHGAAPVRAHGAVTLKSTKEPAMKKPAVVQTKTFTFIDGADASDLSDQEIFQKIADMEGEIAKWSAIKSRPKKLDDAIAKMQASIAALVKYVDERETA